MKPSEQVRQILKDMNINPSLHPSATEEDWATWLNHFERPESHGRCPECGSYLDKRGGKYGEFLGCRSYPDCKYTRNL